MKGYYVHFDAKRWAGEGVLKKIKTQMQELNKHFDMEEVCVYYNERSIFRRVYDIIPFVMSNKYDIQRACKQIEAPDFLYVRSIHSDNQYMDFFRRIREKFPTCKIIVEMPTYPYDKSVEKLLYLRDLWSRRKYSKYVDRITTYSDDTKIFGVRTINIKNGIDVKEIRAVTGKQYNKSINLISISSMLAFHGYERILRGLGGYYRSGGTENIICHMVGEGPELSYYKKIVKDEKITQRVIFYGYKTGKELDEIYDVADIALGTFGFYKIDVQKSSALKTRESLAKGLPIVNGCEIDIFENGKNEYYLEFPNDKSIINIQKIIDFYYYIYQNKDRQAVIEEIRSLAFRTVDMSVTMQPVIEYIKSGKKEQLQ